MRNQLLIFTFSVFLVCFFAGCQDAADAPPPAKEASQPVPVVKAESGSREGVADDGCGSLFRTMYKEAVVELRGTGDLDIVVVTDPLCWHCRLGHKLLGEYPEKYGKLRLFFFPRRSSIGSDMAAWILEDMAGNAKLREYVDFAYTDLKQPKTHDLVEARMLVLVQFTKRFPELLEGTTLEDLYLRLQDAHETHVVMGAEMARDAELPGTPVLIAGQMVLMGYGPGPWLKALDAKKICK